MNYPIHHILSDAGAMRIETPPGIETVEVLIK
jgi:hypothetical protein